MIKNALYKTNKNRDDDVYGYDFIKVLDVKVNREVHWTPTSDKKDKSYKHFWDQLPQGEIHKIVHTDYDVILHGYDKDEKGNISGQDIFSISETEFWENIVMTFDLVSIEGAE